jgi:putative transposase
MPRIARASVEGLPHHVTQRGNYRQVVFEDDTDRKAYLAFLALYKERYGLEVWAWCLMDNHVHLVAVPKGADSLSNTLHMTHMRYAAYANRRHGRQGHLWQGRFYSCVLEGEHVGTAVRYVERNPVRARIVRKAENYRWSSARFHVGGKADGICDTSFPMEDVSAGWRGGWSKWLELTGDEDVIEGLKKSTKTGRPFGSVGFVAKVEGKLGRRVRSLGRGRPRKRRKDLGK